MNAVFYCTPESISIAFPFYLKLDLIYFVDNNNGFFSSQIANLYPIEQVEKEHEHEHPTKPSSLESLKADIICTKCGTLIGTEDIMANGWRLLKANLSVHTPSSEQQSTQRESESDTQEPSWETHSAEILVAAQILEMIERESVRRFVVHPSGAKNGLLVHFLFLVHFPSR